MPEEIRPSVVALVERYHAVLYPFPLDILLERLPEKGWIVPIAAESDDSSMKLSAPASKGGVKLVVDQSLKTLGVRGIVVAEALEAFRELREYAVSTFGLPPAVTTHYTELRYVGTVRASRPNGKTLPPAPR